MSQQYHHPSQPQISTGHMQPPPPTPPLSSAPPHMSVQAHPVGPLVTGPPVFVPQMNTDPPPQPSQISQHSLPNVSSSTSVHLSQPASSFSSSSNHHHLLSSSSYASYPSICRPYLPLSSSSPTLSSPSNFVVPQSLCSPLTSLTSLSSSVSLSSPSSVSPALSSNYSASLPAPLSYSPPEMHSNSYSRSIATSVYNTATQSATDLINVQTSLNATQANVLKSTNSNTQLLNTSTGLVNGTPANAQQIAQLSASPNNNISISAISHPQFVITNTNVPSSLASNTIVSTATENPITMSMASKPALLLTTNDGQLTTVMQHTPTVSGVTAQTTDVASGNSGQIMTQIVSNPNMLPAGMVVNVNRQIVPAFVNATPTHRNMAPQFVINNRPIRITQQVIQGTRPSNGIGYPSSLQGTILLKTDNGHFQFIRMPHTASTANVASLQSPYRFPVPVTGTPSTVASSIAPTVSGGTTMRPQIMAIPANMTNNLQRTAVMTTSTPITGSANGTQRAVVAANSAMQPLSIQTASSSSATSSSTTPQMSPKTAKMKCMNFLSTLLRLAGDQPEQVATNVRNLIQGLIDGNIAADDFAIQLQRELKSGPQPCLIPFLKKSLPYLRHSLMIREMTIDGVKAPLQGTVQLPGQVTLTPAGTHIQHVQLTRPSPQAKPTVTGGATVRLLSGGNLATMTQTSQGVIATGRPAVTPKAIHKYQKLATASGASITVTPATAPLATGTPLSGAISRSNLSNQKKREVIAKGKSPAGAKEKREPPKKKEEKDAFSSSLRDDDDINDVAAMGGVNLMEEHQRILATNAEFVGAQIRSCKDEPFLAANPLQAKINQIARKFQLDEVSSEVVALVSHAAQERLKTLIEKLGIIAEHRIENLKMDNRYEVTQDVRAQIRFLDELDKLEKKRHEEQEREMLLRAAKSRSKLEDPEQLKLKQKAKEMQRAELEEARQREANETALLAIGPRKKMKLSNGSNASFGGSQFNSNSSGMNLSSLGFSTPNGKTQIRRVKRVNIRDLQFLMEQEKETVRTPMLYRAYSK